MSLLLPGALWAALLLPALVLLYLLKLRRKEALIPSTYLWKRSLQDLHANAPFQKLVRNLLLLLQLLLLAGIVLAAARPVLSGSGAAGRTLAILIDVSASMKSKDVAPDRMAAARAAALEAVDDLGPRDEAMLVAFDDQARILAPLTRSRGELRRAVEGAKACDGGSRLKEALLIAASVLRGRSRAAVLVLSDGRCEGAGLELPEGIEVRYLRIGGDGKARNAGITALDARPVPDASGRHEVLVETRSTAPGSGTLSLFQDGGLLDSRKVAWEAGKPAVTVFRAKGGGDARFKAVLETREDDLASDDAAYLVLGDAPARKVLLVTEGNYFLERLLSLDRGVTLFKAKPAEVAERLPEGMDLVILDRWTPKTLPDGSYLFLRAVPPVEGFAARGDLEHPTVLDWKRSHPLLRFASFSNLLVRRSLRWSHPDWAVPLLDSEQGPLLLAAERGNLRMALVGFDLFESDWPFKLSFPVFVSNAVRHLSGREGEEIRSLRTGELLRWQAPSRKTPPEAVIVTDPAGTKHRVPVSPDGNASFPGTLEAGYYEVADGERVLAWGASLRAPGETMNVPVDEADFRVSGTRASPGGALLDQEDLWPWLAMGALLLLLLEWAVYHRRWV